LRDKGVFAKMPNMKEFINPLKEAIQDSPNDLVGQVIQQYLPKEQEDRDFNIEVSPLIITNF
jgi:hypothetical protein